MIQLAGCRAFPDGGPRGRHCFKLPPLCIVARAVLHSESNQLRLTATTPRIELPVAIPSRSDVTQSKSCQTLKFILARRLRCRVAGAHFMENIRHRQVKVTHTHEMFGAASSCRRISAFITQRSHTTGPYKSRNVVRF